MTSYAQQTPQGAPSAEVCAQAAAWIARLHGADRTARVEAGFRRWLAASSSHRTAFEMANEIWDDTQRWPRAEPPALPHRPRSLVLTLPRALAAAAALAAVAVAGGFLYLRKPVIETPVGEQKNVTLADGTHVALNTATRIVVHYDNSTRRVDLQTGEAMFEVARRADQPFIVTAGGKQITALGTAFVVRRDRDRTTVTLVEGSIAVGSMGQTAISAPGSAAGIEVLVPGQRITFADAAAPALDRPAIEKLTAWQRSQVIFDHTPLAEAVEEMNRYSRLRLAVDNAQIAALQVTGVFRTGDSASFAQAVMEAYRLDCATDSGEILLRSPRPPR